MTASPALQAAAAAAPPNAARVAEAHRAVLADKSIQFELPMRQADPPQETPGWLRWLGDTIGSFVEWVGGGWSVLGWGVAIILAALILVALWPSLSAWLEGLRRGSTDAAEPVRWAPAQQAARALLDEADALAAQGRYDEAVHLILFRSIDDIAAWRGELVRPSFTSRDIAHADALPDHARGVFARIVAAVERSLFAGRALGSTDWVQARDDYARFALKGG